MEKQRVPLRLGAPLQFRDRWDGQLIAAEVDSSWTVRNLLLRRGLLLRRTVRVPFSAVSRWDNDVVAFTASADEVFAATLTPMAVVANRIDAQTQVEGVKARLVGLLVHPATRAATHLLLDEGRFIPRERMIPVDRAVVEGGVIKLGAPAETFLHYRPDNDLIQAVRQRIAAHPYLGEDDRRGLRVEAVDGVVYLRGNVRTVAARNRAQECTTRVQGLQGVRNELVDDISLEIAVGQALAAAGLSRQARVFARSIKGELILTGYAPSQEVIAEIQRVASAVVGVRSVTAKLELQPLPPTAEAARDAAS